MLGSIYVISINIPKHILHRTERGEQSRIRRPTRFSHFSLTFFYFIFAVFPPRRTSAGLKRILKSGQTPLDVFINSSKNDKSPLSNGQHSIREVSLRGSRRSLDVLDFGPPGPYDPPLGPRAFINVCKWIT
jgi:hypothetical protein